MANDQTQQFNEHVPRTDVTEHLAPNKKTAVLAEVEEAAMRNANKRFREHFDDQVYEQQKQAQEEEKKGK